MAYDDNEIKRFSKEQQARSKHRRPPTPENVVRKHLEELRVVEMLLAERDFGKYIRRLNENGLKAGSKEYLLALSAWHDRWHGRQ